MPTITGNEINILIDIFNERGVGFYHACQYKDFKTYLRLGGVPSRNLMENFGLDYTHFDTDDVDQDNSVWDKVFGNLSDFGLGFAMFNHSEHTAPLPNPYGPILLVFKPEVFLSAYDVAICLRSAGANGFDRENEALLIEQVNKIFHYENIFDAPYYNNRSYIKWKSDLQKTFGINEVSAPEVSCIVESEVLSFESLDEIIVDPYVVNEISLVNSIVDLTHEMGIRIMPRKYKNGRLEIIRHIAQMLNDRVVDINSLINQESSLETKEYALKLHNGKMHFHYDRFSKYLREGTILELYRESINHIDF